jgi:Antibiotic biosynthesis monooxygenase
MYIAVRKYYIIPGEVDEWMQRVQSGFVPIISRVPGFLSYDAIQVRHDEAVTVSIFETQAGAEESVRQAADWVAKNLASLIQGLPEILVGHVRVHSGPVRSPVNSPQPVPQRA